MSVYTDRVEKDRNPPISYSINIQTSKRPLTCYISTSPSKEPNSNQSIISTKKARRANQSRSTIHLPVTYSTSIHLPCQPSNIKPHSPTIFPSPISYHYHHHYYYHHHRSQPSPVIKSNISPPATTSSTSPDSSLIPKKKLPTPPPPLPSYSALVWNWFHHRSKKRISPPSPPHKGSQSEYSETCRHESPNKRTLLFKFLSSSREKPSRPCFTRQRSQSSSSLPHKSIHYQE